MAIRLIDEYPGRVGAVSADYPHGEPRNRTAPGENDGTPYDQAMFRDMAGFYAALMETADVSPSGDPDTAVNSDLLRATLGLILQMAGFETPIYYEDGLSITSDTQTVIHDGTVYWNSETPISTTGSFDESGWEPVRLTAEKRNAEFDEVTANQYDGPATS